MSVWRSGTLGDVLTLQRGFDITRAVQQAGAVPVVSSSGINSYHNTAMASGPGVVIGRKGTLGTAFYLEGPYWPHDTTLWVKDFKGNDPRFCYYLLKSLDLAKYDVGAANPTLNRNHVHLLDVSRPPIEAQQRIASILGAYDDLIEVNRRRIALLEEMARRLFEEWFIHFGFPDRPDTQSMGTCDGPLPAGWRREPLSAVADATGDSVVPSATPERRFLHFSFPAFDAGQLPVEEDGGAILSNKFSFAAPAVLLGKLNPRIPRVWYVPKSGLLPQIASTEFVPLRPRGRMTLALLYAYVQSSDFAGRLRGLAQGTSTSHQRARPQDIMRMPVAVPPDALLAKADALLSPVYLLTHELRDANARLARSRDLLLPRLISGELSVAAKRELEAAA